MFRVVREASIFVARRNSTCDKMMAGRGRKVTLTIIYSFKEIRKARHITKNILKINDPR
jgi:hypothetical protein